MIIELIGFIGELILEGTLEAGTSKKVPLPLRILLLLLFLGIYVALVGIIVICGISNAREGETAGAVILFAIAAFIAVMVIALFVKTLKSKRR